MPRWLLLVFLIVIPANLLGGLTTRITVELMSSTTEFALTVRNFTLGFLGYFQVVAYLGMTSIILAYLWPLIGYFRAGCPASPSDVVRRRAVSAPLVVAGSAFAVWVFSPLFWGTVTYVNFGQWTRDLVSQQILAPLVSGYLSAVASYLLLDRVFRSRVYPQVFPQGGLPDVQGTWSLGVRGRLFLFLVAVAFVPLFWNLGLIRAADVRLEAGADPRALLEQLNHSAQTQFFVYVLLGAVLTWILASSLTRPLGDAARALERIRRGDLGIATRAGSADEIGRLEEGVGELAATLSDRERILRTFGRVVEPAVRDHLLSGRVDRGGERREATILFCDLRGFTTLAESSSPEEVVATLNRFFTVMTEWVRECGGFVDKFIGDALLVVFGLFDEEHDDESAGAAAAVRCAQGLRLRLQELNSERDAAGEAPLAISVAVHTGDVVAGTIGSADRHEYTVIGDTVNVAARLERLAKDRGGALLVSEACCERARRAGVAPVIRDRASELVPGRTEAVRFCEID